MKDNSSNQSGASKSSVFKSGNGIQVSKSMTTLVGNIAESTQKGNTSQQDNASQQGVEESDKEVQQQVDKNSEEEKSSGKDKKAEGFLVGMLKALLKMLGFETKEEEKEENKDAEKILDELMKLLGLDKEKMQGLQSGATPQSDLQNQNQNQNLNPQQQNQNIQGSSYLQQEESKSKDAPIQSKDGLENVTENETTSTSTSTQNEEEVENNNDKFLTTIIVGLYEKEGKLDSLKEILAQEKDKPENKDNPEMQKLIQGFDDQIAEVEKGREQSVNENKELGENDQALENDYNDIEGLDGIIDTLGKTDIQGKEDNKSGNYQQPTTAISEEAKANQNNTQKY